MYPWRQSPPLPMPMSALDLGMASLGFRRIGRGYCFGPHSWQHQGSASDHVEEPGRVKLLAGHLEALPAFFVGLPTVPRVQ